MRLLPDSFAAAYKSGGTDEQYYAKLAERSREAAADNT
jgi:hypothetical protein